MTRSTEAGGAESLASAGAGIPVHRFRGAHDERAKLRAIVDAHGSLDQIFAWGRDQSPQIVPADVIRQHAFTAGWSTGRPLGRSRTVSVWGRCPTPRQLLDARIAAGWKPTASELQHGDEIEGFAACVFIPKPSRTA